MKQIQAEVRLNENTDAPVKGGGCAGGGILPYWARR
jgi:hypothetical protein